MSNLSTLPKGDSAWLLRKAIERIIQQVSVLETNIGASTTGNSANTQVIFNDNGVLRGDPDLTFNTSLNKLIATNLESTTALVVGTSATITGDLTVATNRLIVNSVGVSTGGSPAGNFGFSTFGKTGGFYANKNTANQYLAFQMKNSTQDYAMFIDQDGVGSNSWSIFDNTNAHTAMRYYPGVGGSWIHYINGTTAMTLNSTGLGIGDAPASGEKLTVLGSIYLKTANKLKLDNASNNFGASIHNIGASAQAALAFTLGATQAMTLDASGNLLVGKTAIGTTVGIEVRPDGYLVVTRSATTDATGFTNAVYSSGASAYRFYVGMGGTVYATNTTISSLSDARLKENIQDIDVGLAAILSLKPRKFDWKDGRGKGIKGDRGFIAQEFETVFPNLVDEWKDPAPEGEAPYKSVRQDLIPVLVKAIQELTARVQTLEAR